MNRTATQDNILANAILTPLSKSVMDRKEASLGRLHTVSSQLCPNREKASLWGQKISGAGAAGREGQWATGLQAARLCVMDTCRCTLSRPREHTTPRGDSAVERGLG